MKLYYTPTALRKLKRIGKKDQPKIKRKIDLLKQNSQIGRPLAGVLKGKRKLVAWPLRIIYSLNEKSQEITIEVVDYRGSVYKK